MENILCISLYSVQMRENFRAVVGFHLTMFTSLRSYRFPLFFTEVENVVENFSHHLLIMVYFRKLGRLQKQPNIV